MDQWYYVDANNGRQGPVDVKVIRGKLGCGELNGESLVWCEGMAAWQPASAVWTQLADVGAESGPGAGTGGSSTGTNNEMVAVPAPCTIGNDTPSPSPAPSSTLSVGDGMVVAGDQVVYAGFWRRVAAYQVDCLIS